MTEPYDQRVLGGVSPFGYRWQGGKLVIDQNEAPVRKLIFELFAKHKKKKIVAKILNDLGYRTRHKALFSDTTIDRLLRDTTAKGIRIIKERPVMVDPIVDAELWERANMILCGKKQTKQSVKLFSGIAFCECKGKMLVPTNSTKYVCKKCRRKIPVEDLNDIFESQLKKIELSSHKSNKKHLSDYWSFLTQKEKRIIVEQICDKITIGDRHINIELGYSPNSPKTATFEQQINTSDETVKTISVQSNVEQIPPAVTAPLLSEADAADFIGVSKITLLRKRKAGIIGFYRVGFRILYSKEKHLIPFLESIETKSQITASE